MSGSLWNWKAPSDNRPRKSTRGRREEPYVLGPHGEFDRDEFEAPENLMVAYQISEREGGHAPGVDGIKYGDLSPSEVYSALREISKTLHNGTYRPQLHREVIIPKSNGKYRTLNIPTIFDRTVSKALQLAVQPFSVVIYSNMIFKDPWTIFAEIEREIRDTGNMYLTTADITNFYPSIMIDDALEAHREIIENPFLLRLIEQVMRGHEGLKKTRGLSQGDPYSPLAADVTIRHILSQSTTEKGEDIPSCWRYADNFTIATQNAHKGNRALTRLQETLGQHELTLRPTGETDLRETESNSTNVLGLVPQQRNKQLHWRTPEKTWQELDTKLAECWETQNPNKNCDEILTGYINAIGPALTTEASERTAQRASEMARTRKLNPPNPERLKEVAKQARQHWYDLRSRILKGHNGHTRVRNILSPPPLPVLLLPVSATAPPPPLTSGNRPR